jgi:alginate O-acetyltransferase complex protein AlgI
MTFLLIFLPLALVLYYITPGRVKEAMLLLISIVFYAIGSPEYIVLLAVATVLTVLLGRGIDRCGESGAARKILLVLGILLNLSLLGYYKYSGAFFRALSRAGLTENSVTDIALPLGISFFTFKAISYLADVYRKKTELSGNPIRDALYLTFFAQIQSGPLASYSDMTLVSQKRFDADLFSDGTVRFLTGFGKKVLLADTLVKVTNEIFSAPFDTVSTPYLWLGSLCYSLQLFFDFSGYSDMAIGITEMFGYHCPENFDYPYTTDSVSRFWRKWHITLGAWFRDYVYIPMGGSRSPHQSRVILNLFIVWLLTGIWHGASLNFIAWGLGYFIVISLEKLLNLPGRLRTKAGKVIYRILTLFFINFQWVLFRAPSLTYGLQYIKRMLLPVQNEMANWRTLFLLRDYGFFMAAAVLLCTPVVPAVRGKLESRPIARTIYDAVIGLVILAAFVWAVSFVVAGQNNPFVYANF